MDEKTQEFRGFFPLYIQSDEYFIHHFEHLKKCIEEELYSSAYLHLHILYMLFIYIHILRIARKKAAEFKLSLISIPEKGKSISKKLDSPFVFSIIPEKSIFHFFKIVGFNEGHIGNISSEINERNNHFHAKGLVHLRDTEEFEQKFDSYLHNMILIVKKQILFLKEIYTLKINKYEYDFAITLDEIELSFSNNENFFSLQELKLLAAGKQDTVSEFIRSGNAAAIIRSPTKMSKFEKLREHILSLSKSDDFVIARNEWALFKVELSESVEGETCPCGQTHIKELCYIRNTENKKKIFVGNVCINQFMNIDTGNFFDGIRRLRKTPESNPNFDVIKHAQELGYLHDSEYGFLCDIRRKRKLSDKQKKWRDKIVRRILRKIVVNRQH